MFITAIAREFLDMIALDHGTGEKIFGQIRDEKKEREKNHACLLEKSW